MNFSTPGFPVHHQIPEFTQTHVQWVGDTIQPSHPLSFPSPTDFNLSQIQGLFNVSVLRIRWPKYWSFSFSISPSNEHSGLISMTLDSAVCPRARTHWTKSHGTEVGMALITTLSHLFGEFLLPSHATQLWLIPVPYIGEEEAASTTKRHSKSFIKSKARDFLDGPVVKNPPANAGDTDPIPGCSVWASHCGGFSCCGAWTH